MRKVIILDIVTALLIILFLYTGIMKLTDFDSFYGVLRSHPFVSGYARIIAIVVPSIELLVAIMLSVTKWRRIGLYVSLALMILFTGYTIWILKFSNDIPCTCGGVIEHMTWKQHFWFNILYVTISIVGIYLEKKIGKQKRLITESNSNLSYGLQQFKK